MFSNKSHLHDALFPSPSSSNGSSSSSSNGNRLNLTTTTTTTGLHEGGGKYNAAPLVSGIEALLHVMENSPPSTGGVLVSGEYALNHHAALARLPKHGKFTTALAQQEQERLLHDTVLLTGSNEIRDMLPVLYKHHRQHPAVWHAEATSRSRLAEAKDSGVVMVGSGSVQEIHDMAIAARMISRRLHALVMHFFDGTRTSRSAVSRVELASRAEISEAIHDAKMSDRGNHQRHRRDEDGSGAGEVEEEDPLGVIATCLRAVNPRYAPFEFYGAPDADFVVVATPLDAAKCMEEIAKLRRNHVRCGLVVARVVRPWSAAAFASVVPATTRRIAASEGELCDQVAASLAHLPHSQPIELTPPSPGHVFPLNCIPTHGEVGVDQHHLAYTSSSTTASVYASAYNSTTLQQQAEIASSTATPSLTKQLVAFSSSPHVSKLIADHVLNRRLGYHVQHFASAPGGASTCETRFGPIAITCETPIRNADVVTFDDEGAILECPSLGGVIGRREAAIVVNTTATPTAASSVLSAGMRKFIGEHSVRLYFIDASRALPPGSSSSAHVAFLVQTVALMLVSEDGTTSFKQILHHLSREAPLGMESILADEATLRSHLKRVEYPIHAWATLVVHEDYRTKPNVKSDDGHSTATTGNKHLASPSSSSSSTLDAPEAHHHPLGTTASEEEAENGTRVYASLLRQIFHNGAEIVTVSKTGAESLEAALGATIAASQSRHRTGMRIVREIEASHHAGDSDELLQVAKTWARDKDSVVKSRAFAHALATVGGPVANVREIEDIKRVHRWIVGGSDAADLQAVHQVVSSREPVRAVVVVTDATQRRDLGLYAMSYGGVYVASVCLDFSHAQATRALIEASEFNGPSLVVALAPSPHAREAVDDGSWPLYRWNPSSVSSPFSLDSSKLKEHLATFLRRDQQLSLMARERPKVVNAPSLESELDARASEASERMRRDYEALVGGGGEKNGVGAAGGKKQNLNLLVLYGSDGGNGAGVADTIAKRAELSGCGESRCLEANEFKVDDLQNETLIVFVLSTAGQGEDCANAKKFGKELMEKRAGFLKPTTKFAVFGLGDSSYWGAGTSDSAKYFCLPARRLFNKMKELGATPVVSFPGLGDDQHEDGYDGALVEWENQFWKELGVTVVKGGDLGGAPPIVDDDIKIKSNYLRGTIAEGLADTSTGKLIPEDCKITKFHGIYQQDNRDEREALDAKGLERSYSFMIRIGIPGGVATAEQYLAMDDLCNRYANGRLKCTTRQAYQLHGVVKGVLKATMQGINRACMDTLAACGDVNRNIIANPEASKGEVYRKVNELARAIDAHLKPRTSAYHEIWLDKKPVAGYVDKEPLYGPTYLPRKFKIAIAVPPSNDVDVFAHCVGFIAIVDKNNPLDGLLGYNVTVGGGFGTTHGNKATYPRLADVMGFCLPDQALKVVECIMTVQRDYGERVDRKHARLKYTVEDHGVAWFRERVEERCGFKLSEARPFKFESNSDAYGWRKSKDGKSWTFTMFVENGVIYDTATYKLKSAMREIANELASCHGQISLTANQNVILGNIPNERKPRILELLQKWGVNNERHSAMRLHSMACVALPTCALAMAESQRYLPTLIDKLEATLDEVGLRHDAITIRMTGCPNGCARPYCAEIAFVGKAPGVYNLHLGGGHAGNRLNRIYKEGVNEEQILAILRPMLQRYALERKPGERFGDFTIRTGIVMPVYHGHSFWATTAEENDDKGVKGPQIYW